MAPARVVVLGGGVVGTNALCNAALPYALKLAGSGYLAVARADAGLAQGFRIIVGRLADSAVGRAFGLPVVPLNRTPEESSRP